MHAGSGSLIILNSDNYYETNYNPLTALCINESATVIAKQVWH